ncbi:MAG: N-acetylmuramoyl-L-alanine amidase family protein [Planctomycetota bacterium]
MIGRPVTILPGPRRRWGLPLLVGLVLLGAGGCAGLRPVNVYQHETVPQPQGTMSVYQLAGILGMKVSDVSASSATLRDARNTVLLLSDPGGQAYVNGRPVGPVGGYVVTDHTLFVPRISLEPIRASLQPAPSLVVRDRQRRRRPTSKNEGTPRVDSLPSSSSGGVVMIDAGHGGKDPGATSVTGMSEKWINLAIVKRMTRLLRGAGVTVILTRDDDLAVPLQSRAKLANARRPDLLVSVHGDAAKPSVHGYNVYIAPVSSSASYRAALRVSAAMKDAGVAPHGQPVRRKALFVLVKTTCPAILVETGFITNPREGARLTTSKYQQTIAHALAGGVLKHLEAEAKRN